MRAAKRAHDAGNVLHNSAEWLIDVQGIGVDATQRLVCLLLTQHDSPANNTSRPKLAALQATCHIFRFEGLEGGLPATTVMLQYELAKECFHCSVQAREEGRLSDAHQLLSTTLGTCLDEATEALALHHPGVAEKKILFRVSSVYQEAVENLEELAEDIEMERAVVGALIDLQAGEQSLKAALHDSEELEVDKLWTAVDHIRASIVSARERDIEAEAKAQSLLGSAFLALFPNKPQVSHVYFQRSVELAHSLFPRPVTDEGWFSEALRNVKAYQERVSREEEQQEARDAAPFLSKLRKEIDNLMRASEASAIELLDLLYNKIKPENYGVPPSKVAVMKARLKRDSSPEVKKQLQTAIVHFHSDKNLAGKYGMLWHVYCGEITKVLNQKYAIFK